MIKIKQIIRVPYVVLNNLLDTRYRRKIMKKNKRRKKNVSDSTL
mgnify:FL=1|jgi:hypothetical protein